MLRALQAGCGLRPGLARMQACKLNFAAGRLAPLGSYPRVRDKKGAHDLFGPVNKLYCTAYDRAAILFLACLKAAALSCCLYALSSG